MPATISQEFQVRTQQQQDFRRTAEEWILQYEPFFTHALTLTFNHTKVRRQMLKIDSSLCLNSPVMIDLYKANVRAFKWKLAKSLYGNSWKRFNRSLVFIPVLEGLGRDEKPHYHCVLGVDAEKFPMVHERVCSIWNKVPFGGNRVDVQPYISSGWTRYSTKNALFANRENIDWENVLVPQHKSPDE